MTAEATSRGRFQGGFKGSETLNCFKDSDPFNDPLHDPWNLLPRTLAMGGSPAQPPVPYAARIAPTSITRTSPVATGSSTARVSARTICPSVTSPNRSAPDWSDGIREASA